MTWKEDWTIPIPWTKEPPSESGWYLCIDKSKQSPINDGEYFLVYLEDGQWSSPGTPPEKARVDEYPSLIWTPA